MIGRKLGPYEITAKIGEGPTLDERMASGDRPLGEATVRRLGVASRRPFDLSNPI